MEEINKTVLTFEAVQKLLEELQGEKDASFLFISNKGHFSIYGNLPEIEAELSFAMCRFPSIEQIVKTCAKSFDYIKEKYGKEVESAFIPHLIEEQTK